MQRSRTKRRTRVAKRVRPTKRTSRRAAARAVPYHHLSHSGALINEIISGEDSSFTTAEAMALASLLSNLTDTMQQITYGSGFSAGRLVYSISEHGKGYRWKEDSMPDLVSFLERAGYPRVSYHVFPGDFWLRLHNKGASNLGANIHAFEAGLIAGFMSASGRHTVSATEAICSMDGQGECMFTSQSGGAKRPGRESVERLVDHVSRMAMSGRKHKADVPVAYYMLASNVLYDRAYMDAIKQVVSHIGVQISNRMISGKRKGVDSAIATIELLGLGHPRLRMLSPIELDVSFTGRHTRRELTELSIAFISGLLNNLVAKNRTLEAATSHTNGNYTVRIREVRLS
ncbi:MAG: hypothetical protein KGH58_02055 [Candidatus Micrarchaeota archaeon]|nr:hypothetical protein [Candidatus Micrarchaeota archaeon]